MTDADTAATPAADRAALSRLKLSELQALAEQRGIAGAGRLRKGELVDSLSTSDDAAVTAPGDAPAETAVETSVETPR